MGIGYGKKIVWPGKKKFAFTIFDDTDLATIDNVSETYAFLDALGMRTTKSVWPIKGSGDPVFGGDTLQDERYLKWVMHLKNRGFEIAFHNATYHSSTRAETIKGLEDFKRLLGDYPASHANHAGCEEGIYWGENRLTGMYRQTYKILTRNRRTGFFRGQTEGDKFFWGDICSETIKYVRSFVFSDINTLKVCPFMPYYDASRPYVNNWFPSSEGGNPIAFSDCISEKNQDRLEKEGGACIMYTHFANGFLGQRGLNRRFMYLMERLSNKNGWFVPVETLLDFLLEVNGRHIVTAEERARMERQWLCHKIRVGST